jgi:predicted permease
MSSRRPFWYLRRGPERVAADVNEELQLHLDMRVQELKAKGRSDTEARREALEQFGDLERTRAYCRQQDHDKERRMQWGLWLGDFAQDLRISLRGLARSPMMAVTIVATVGLGIGVSTAIFSAVNAALLQPLPYANPERLVRIYTDSPPNRFRFSVVDYQALDAQQTTFERIAAFTDREAAFADGQVAERIRGRVVTWTYFSLLGLTPALGRDFTEADGRPGSPPAAIVTHGFWLRRLGGRSDVIGTPIRLDGVDHMVAGVLPPTNTPLERRQDFFVAAQWLPPSRKGPFFLTVLARLRNEADRPAAAEELRAINKRIFPLWKSSYQDERATWTMTDLKEAVIGDVHATAALALGGVGLVWLIACANASNLLIARVTSRRRELAVRAALGASRDRVVRYLLAESALLAFGAALVGLVVAWLGIRVLQNFGSAYFPRTGEIALDGPVLGALVALTVAAGVLFGLVPALHGSGRDLDTTLRSGGRSSTGTVSVRRLRRALVGAQFAITTPLLVAAGLLLVSLNKLGRVDIGFDTRNMLSGSISLPAAQYEEPGRVLTFWDELQRRTEALPGVATVAFSDGRPPDDVGNFNNFDLEDKPAAPGESQPVAPWVWVTPEYFRLLGLTLLHGRLFDERDGRGPSVDAVIVDRAWARRFFPTENVVGKRFKEGGCSTCPWTTVVGVVSDVKYAGLDNADGGSVYWPMTARGVLPQEGAPPRTRYIILRTSIDPTRVLPSVRQILRELDPNLPFSDVATFDEMVAQSLNQPRSLSLLVGCFAAVALLLSAVGIYGVMAYYVQQHAKDISIRLALGGRPRDVWQLVVGQGMKVVSSGVAIGLLAAVALTRLMSGVLFGVKPLDPSTFAGVGCVLVAVALVACLVPAGRAVAVEPSMVLRND